MGVKFKTAKNKFPEMIKTAKALNGRKVQVGCIQGDHAWLASIHEYGCNIPVTDKMRAFLHSKGVHLKKSTKYIHIPERSFLRSGHDKNISKIMAKSDKLIKLVLGGQMTEDEYLEQVGLMLATAIKTYARDLSSPPNSDFTIQEKGSNNPLVDTGNLIEGIMFEVE